MSKEIEMTVSNDLPEAIPPIFETDEPNKNIKLFEGNIRVSQGPLVISGKGVIELSWLPSPKTIFSLTPDGEGHFSLSHDERVRVSAPVIGLQADAEVRKLAENQVSGWLIADVETGEGSEVDSVYFHLANFLNFDGVPVKDEGYIYRGGELKLETGEWTVRIDEVREQRKLLQSVRETGGYTIMHVGKLRRTNGGVFGLDEAKEVLAGLAYLLSFMSGRWTPPILPVAYRQEEQVWQSWNVDHSWNVSHSVSVWSGRLNWFPRDLVSRPELEIPKHLNTLAKSFFMVYKDEERREALTLAIAWYIQSHEEKNLETSIILTQVALELLAWLVVIETKHTPEFSENEFKNKSLKFKIEKLLNYLDIPKGMPRELSALSEKYEEDGVQAITEVRNKLVHPRPSNREGLETVLFNKRGEVKGLSIWYLELVLLKFLNYHGQYHSRISATERFQTEVIPWATK